MPAETAFKGSSGTLTPLASQAEAPFQALKNKLPFIRDNWDENLWRKGHLSRKAGGFGLNILVVIHITFTSCQQKWRARSEQMQDCLCVLPHWHVQAQSHKGFKGMTDLRPASQCCIRQLINSHYNWEGEIQVLSQGIIFKPLVSPPSFLSWYRSHKDKH